ncbi:DUF6115 domain-containing protein [Paenibacillus pini]|uniref:Uncharacterized protein n=1 Tax=Paenibacillus pini JCM 16418 TaxID=1236976 RepID=W7YMN9_9BACL|nr:hypothetical protein [Paenibacillus pini]GAF09717.1 hypothetical protein JCM16418_3871 [Paenibacillus pini JCM 16418]
MEPWMIVVVLGAAALVYALLLPKQQKGEAASADKVVKEVEATLEQYMADIEKENDELVDLISQMKQDTSSRQLAQQEQLAELRQRIVLVEQQAAANDLRLNTAENKHSQQYFSEAKPSNSSENITLHSEEATTELEENISLKKHEPSIKDRYPELFEMYSNGKSVDVIGKMMGLHSGEVQLILQLAKQEELQ